MMLVIAALRMARAASPRRRPAPARGFREPRFYLRKRVAGTDRPGADNALDREIVAREY
jgi:hypothetical protein